MNRIGPPWRVQERAKAALPIMRDDVSNPPQAGFWVGLTDLGEGVVQLRPLNEEKQMKEGRHEKY